MDFGACPQRRRRGGPAPAVDDQLTRPNRTTPTGKSVMRRVPEVLDVWLTSGHAHAQVHYPMENRERFETHNPGDRPRYIGQTCGRLRRCTSWPPRAVPPPGVPQRDLPRDRAGSGRQKMSKSAQLPGRQRGRGPGRLDADGAGS
ncbi:hypothetical protein QJS66_01650 [Kocuria rhizophila]|nr:hypothetical protein QJS66_01650 [Kocuria rhizophila]